MHRSFKPQHSSSYLISAHLMMITCMMETLVDLVGRSLRERDYFFANNFEHFIFIASPAQAGNVLTEIGICLFIGCQFL